MASAPAGTDTTTYRISSFNLVLWGFGLVMAVGFFVSSFFIPGVKDSEQFVVLGLTILVAVAFLISCISKVTIAPGVVTVHSLSDPREFLRGSTTLAAEYHRSRDGKNLVLLLTDTRNGTKASVDVTEMPRRKRAEFLAAVAAALGQPVPVAKDTPWWRPRSSKWQ